MGELFGRTGRRQPRQLTFNKDIEKNMGRSPCCDDTGLKKGPWTAEEDEKLIKHIQKHGHGSWRALPKLAGLSRCGKSCRLRWTNYLRPDIKRGKFSPEEEQTILNLHSVLGNKWSTIATHLPGRTDNEIKNFWNTHLKKKLIQMGFDPMTHRPRTDIFSSLPHLIALANLKELMMEHQNSAAMRLQTEAAAQVAKLHYLQYLLQPPNQSSSNSTAPAFPNNMNNIADMEAYNLLNSLSTTMKDSSVLSSLLVPNGTTLQAVTNDDYSSIPFSHLPDLGEASNFSVNDLTSHGEKYISPTNSPWLQQPSNLSPSPPANINPPITIDQANSLTNSTNSSFEGAPSSSSIWPELLLDDPFFS